MVPIAFVPLDGVDDSVTSEACPAERLHPKLVRGRPWPGWLCVEGRVCMNLPPAGVSQMSVTQPVGVMQSVTECVWVCDCVTVTGMVCVSVTMRQLG